MCYTSLSCLDALKVIQSALGVLMMHTLPSHGSFRNPTNFLILGGSVCYPPIRCSDALSSFRCSQLWGHCGAFIQVMGLEPNEPYPQSRCGEVDTVGVAVRSHETLPGGEKANVVDGVRKAKSSCVGLAWSDS